MRILSQDVIVYHREGCHLCEEVLASLSQFEKELGYKIKPIDIDEDSKLRAKYNVDIPVVMVNDEVIFYHFFDEKALRAAFSN